MEEPVQAVAPVGEEVEELPSLVRRPDHDGRRLDAGAQQFGDALIRPHKCLGALGGCEFDVRGGVEHDQPTRDGDAQRGT
ncbi:hypothetical protein [Streptomyces sp. NPDC059080]|uniref:hypothetical protein n=1 Tax=Streptomyces sp. NPDC059080 TaxID=3346718 RepID=UPI0036A7C751